MSLHSGPPDNASPRSLKASTQLDPEPPSYAAASTKNMVRFGKIVTVPATCAGVHTGGTNPAPAARNRGAVEAVFFYPTPPSL